MTTLMQRYAPGQYRDVPGERPVTASGDQECFKVTEADAELGVLCCGCRHQFAADEVYAERPIGAAKSTPIVEIVCLDCFAAPAVVPEAPVSYGQVRDLPDPEGWHHGTIPVVVVEGMATGDGRIIPAGSLSGHRALPIALMSLSKTSEGGHLDATVFGRIDQLERVPGPDAINIDTGEPFPEGTFVWRSNDVWVNPEHPDYGWARSGALSGISVDLSETEAELQFDEDGPEDGMLVLSAGRIAASTLCTIPAFPGAHLVLDDVAPALAASAHSHDVLVWANPPGGRTSTGKELPAGWVWVCSCGETGNGLDTEDAADTAALVHESGVTPLRASASPSWRMETEALCASCTAPPAAWFTDPHLAEPTPLTVTEDGRVFGHAADFSTCHIGLPGCVRAPRSRSGYAYFLTGSVFTADGTTVPVGRITLGTGHADLAMGAAAATEHYDHTGACVADVAAGEDEHGIWLAGAVRPGTTPEQLRALQASPLSGDWRPIGGSLELVGVLSVNVPGFPIPHPRAVLAGGVPTALVAAGAVPPSKEKTVTAPDPKKAPPKKPADPKPPTGGSAPLQEGDVVTIDGTDLRGVVILADDESSVAVQVTVDASKLQPVDAPAEEPVMASARDLALLRSTRAEQILRRHVK